MWIKEEERPEEEEGHQLTTSDLVAVGGNPFPPSTVEEAKVWTKIGKLENGRGYIKLCMFGIIRWTLHFNMRGKNIFFYDWG